MKLVMKTSIKLLVLFLIFVNGIYSQCDSYGSISVSTSGFEAGSGYTQEYVLVSETTGVILEINSLGSFNSLESGQYFIYAVNYEGIRPTVLIVGGLWSDVNIYDANATNCFEALSPYSGGSITVCNQGCTNDPLTVSSSGYYTGGSSTQTYVLVLSPAASNNIITSNLTGEFSSSVFSTESVYEVYAVNTEVAAVATAISAGNSWSGAESVINANCADLIGPLFYEINDAHCVSPLSEHNIRLVGEKSSASNFLEWSYDDIEVDYFNIYKSDGESPYQKIAKTVNPFFEDLNIGDKDYYKVELISESVENGVYSNSIKLERDNSNDVVVLYPNPTSDILKVSFTANNVEVELRILNGVGQIVKSDIVEANKGSNTFEIDVSNLANGVYFIQCNMDEKMIVERFIKH